MKSAPGLKTSLAAFVALSGSACAAAEVQGFSPRPEAPRLSPVDPSSVTPAQAAMLASRPDYNIYKTLAHHPVLYARWSELGRFLLNGSSLPARHREIVMLRMGWLCQSEYEWSQHSRIAKTDAGLSDAEVHRIAEGPNAAGWSPFETTLLTMVDELRYEAMISDTTWSALHREYTDQQVLEVLFTAAQYQLVSMALNSLGVQLDPELEDRLPRDVASPAVATLPTLARLSDPRIAPIAISSMTEEQRSLVQSRIGADGALPNLYATLAVHPKLYGPRLSFGSYLQRDSQLPARVRELLILRTSVLMQAPYEWGHHVPAAREAGLTDEEVRRILEGPSAGGWSEADRVVLRAADELWREAFLSDATWKALKDRYSDQQTVEIIYTVGGYAMTALALNSLGVQLEPGFERLPMQTASSARAR